jgi:pimeloyl-ACP methyl ester carboxylesterase
MGNMNIDTLDHEIATIELSDGYTSHYRLWGPPSGKDVIIILHGGMSHSEWQAPLAKAIGSISDISFVAVDRRGCGLNNEDRGDLKTAEIVFDDVAKHLMFFKESFSNVHLAGWCQGCQFAVPAVHQMKDKNIISSLILMTPGFFWSERFSSVLENARKSLLASFLKDKNIISILILMTPGFFWSERFSSVLENARKFLLASLSKLNDKPNPKKPFIPIPMLGRDFTSIKEWLDYIENDQLKSTQVSLNTVGIMQLAQRKSTEEILHTDIPILLILAEKDRIVDNQKVKDHLNGVLNKNKQSRTILYKTEHAVHFEKTEDLAEEIVKFISNV